LDLQEMARHVDPVAPAAADEDVRARSSEQPVGARAASDHVVAGAAPDDVVAASRPTGEFVKSDVSDGRRTLPCRSWR
jgi:hypothetical protein